MQTIIVSCQSHSMLKLKHWMALKMIKFKDRSILFVYLCAWASGMQEENQRVIVRVCVSVRYQTSVILYVHVWYICLQKCVWGSEEHTISIQQLPQRSFPKQAPGRDRDRATAAFWWCNRKLIETINMVLIIKAQVLRWHFADCCTVGRTRIHTH